MIKSFLKFFLPSTLRWFLRRQFLKFRGLLYRGNKYYCPCCEKNYRSFLAMKEGDKTRPNVVCPGCGVVERHRLLKLFLAEKTNIYSKPQRVLYFAPEYSLQKHLKKQKNIDYISTDIDSSLAMEQFDIMDIPHEDASFSIIFCSHVLAHVKNDIQALKELYRILMKNGKLIILDTPSEQAKTLEFENIKTTEERIKAYGQADRWRLYGQDFEDRLSSVGFQVSTDNFAKKLSNEIVERSRLSREELVYICSK